MFKSEYLNRVYAGVEARNPGEKEFLQAVYEVLESLEPVVEANPRLEANGILERIVEPERQIFAARYYALASMEEIAARSGYSQGKVKSMLHRTRLRLRAELEKEGYC